MKRKILLVSIIYMLATMSGCVEALDLDETQQDKFVGYVVYSVLEHDKNYMVGLNDVVEDVTDNVADDFDDEQPSVEQPTVEDSTSSSTENNNITVDKEPAITTTMDRALDVEGVSVKYTGVIVDDVFPKAEGEPVFALKAYTGNKLVVLKFDVTNTTNSDITLDMVSTRSIEYI